VSTNFQLPPTPKPNYDYTRSTEVNHEDRDAGFVGDFRDIRGILDYAYHGSYSAPRQVSVG
jgi:hypothetical protein